MKKIIKKILPKKFVNFLVYKKIVFLRNFKTISLKGDAIECPCCHKKFKKLADFTQIHHLDTTVITEVHKNLICPFCHSCARHRNICYNLSQNHSLPINNILIIAPEFCIIYYFKSRNLKFVTVDLLRDDVDFKVNIENLPFKDNSFDLIICNHVLEHVNDYKKALLEIKRSIKPNGKAIISVPVNLNINETYEDPDIISCEARFLYYGQEDHLRLFGNNFLQILENCGFKVEIVDGKNLPEKIAANVSIENDPRPYTNNLVYFCQKQS